MVAFFRFFQHVQVGFLIFFFRPGGAVNAGQHFVFAIAAPISTRDFHQLEHFQFAGRWHMRAAA